MASDGLSGWVGCPPPPQLVEPTQVVACIGLVGRQQGQHGHDQQQVGQGAKE